MTRRRLAALAAVLSLSSVARADDDARARARDLAQQGDAAFAQGRCDKAVPLWRRAEESFHAPTILLRMARCQALLGRVVDATATLESIAAEKLAPDVPASWREAQRDATQDLPAVRARVASLTVTVDGAGEDAAVLVDDTRVAAGRSAPIDPGTHRVRVHAGDAQWEQGVPVGEGEARVLAFRVSREPGRTRTSPFKPLGYALGAGGLAALAFGGAIFGSSAVSTSNALGDACGPDRAQCPIDRQAEIDRLKTRALVADVFMGAGAVAFMAGAIMVIASPAPQSEGPRFRVTPMGAGAQLIGSF